ncbi:MAG: cupin domain-containing protein [Oscillospiraceae bacterium]|nr:cupin domain-containing protein [Oscillospiraceae bacterium]
MSYKITRKDEAYKYDAPGHFDVRTTRLHDPGDVNDGVVTMGLSHFLPGGGCEYSSNARESIYYIIEGQMYLESEIDTENEVKTTLFAGDTYHCGPNTKKSVVNNGTTACQMLVVLK